MFPPILHNLTPDDAAYKPCQAYNKLIGQKAERAALGSTLHEKLSHIKVWEADCQKALDACHAIMRKD